jgi:2-polyprenyl-3-methyl-5-hydroxy-6-metoxy-1,4-benzoquinol methylase
MKAERPDSRGEAAALESAPCDLCGADDAVTLFPATIRDDGSPAGDDYSSSRRKVTHGRIVRCNSCGLVRTDPRDTSETRSAVYGALDDPHYDLETVSRTTTAHRYLAFVERYAPRSGRLLDVGCSTGIFMAAARSRGWDVQGIETSSWAVGRARERFDLEHIQPTAVETAVLPPNSFDVVTLWDVLEHVGSPTAVLNRVSEWLKPTGHIFLTVPNIESTMARFMGERWPLLLREHLWYFSPATSARLMEQTGFAMLETRTNHVTFSLSNVMVRLGQHRGSMRPLWNRLAGRRITQRLRIRFPIGEINVAARRD